MYRFVNSWYPTILVLSLSGSFIINYLILISEWNARSLFQIALNCSTAICILINKKNSLLVGIRIWAFISLFAGLISLLSVGFQVLINRYSFGSDYYSIVSHACIFVIGCLLLLFLGKSTLKIES